MPESLFGLTFPCQKLATSIFERTVCNVRQQNTGMVCYRYLQSMKGLNFHIHQSMLFGAAALIFIFSPYVLKPLSSGFWLMSLAITGTYVNVKALRKYHQANSLACEYLNRHLSPSANKELTRLHYNKSGLIQLVELLRTHKIPCEQVKEKVSYKYKITIG